MTLSGPSAARGLSAAATCLTFKTSPAASLYAGIPQILFLWIYKIQSPSLCFGICAQQKMANAFHFLIDTSASSEKNNAHFKSLSKRNFQTVISNQTLHPICFCVIQIHILKFYLQAVPRNMNSLKCLLT